MYTSDSNYGDSSDMPVTNSQMVRHLDQDTLRRGEISMTNDVHHSAADRDPAGQEETTSLPCDDFWDVPPLTGQGLEPTGDNEHIEYLDALFSEDDHGKVNQIWKAVTQARSPILERAAVPVTGHRLAGIKLYPHYATTILSQKIKPTTNHNTHRLCFVTLRRTTSSARRHGVHERRHHSRVRHPNPKHTSNCNGSPGGSSTGRHCCLANRLRPCRPQQRSPAQRHFSGVLRARLCRESTPSIGL